MSSLFSLCLLFFSSLFFFFNDTATTEIYTLSLHDALPILATVSIDVVNSAPVAVTDSYTAHGAVQLLPELVANDNDPRSEEHTSELQSHLNLVCRLLLEKKKTFAAG